MEANPDIAFVHGRELCLTLEPGETPAVEFEPLDIAPDIIEGREFILRRCRDPRNTIGAPTVLRRVSAQKRIGHYRPELPYTDDFEMWLRLATLGRVAETSRAQGIRRVHGGQATESYRKLPARDFIEHMAAFDSFFAHEGRQMQDAAKLHRLVRKTIAVNALWYGLWRAELGDKQNAELCIQYGVKLYPPLTVPRLIKRAMTGEIGWRETRSYLSALLDQRDLRQLVAH